MPPAKWTKGSKKIKGVWTAIHGKDQYVINIFKKCSVSGLPISFTHDTPVEFNGWKIVKETDGP